MKIWIDILTPKQLLFFEPIIAKLGKKHEILCTSRKYGEVVNLAKIRDFDIVFIGKYGFDKKSKLEESIYRLEKLTRKISKFSPDITISFCSPEAARISFGLGIKHVAFTDSPHNDIAMRLTLPLIQKLLIPKVISKNEFIKYGIKKKDIISYNAIDAAITIKRKVNSKASLPFKKNQKKNILIRIEEIHATYISKTNIITIIKKIIDTFGDENIVILGRYPKQIKDLRIIFGKKVKIVKMSFDGKHLLDNTDVFIGSGGTMSAESALLGIPTITYNAGHNWTVENSLVKKGFMKRETNPIKICRFIEKSFSTSNKKHMKKIKKFLSEMEDPVQKLIQEINNNF